MDAISVVAVVGFALALVALAHATGHYQRGPFVYLLRRMAVDVSPYSAAIARMLYAAAAVLLLMAIATFVWPAYSSRLPLWTSIAVIFAAALAGAFPARLRR